MSGMFGSQPDYSIVMVAGNKGIGPMAREHILLCLMLHVPFLVVLSKIDLSPTQNKETLVSLRKLLKAPGVTKTPMVVHDDSDLPVCIQHTKTGSVVPIVKVSFKTGEGVKLLIKLLNCLPPRTNYGKLSKKPVEMSVKESFHVKGTGTVIHGLLTQGTLCVGEKVLVGPTGTGSFMSTRIRSLHCKRVLVQEITAGKHACINVVLDRSKIKRGMMVISADNPPKSIWEFKAHLYILKNRHHTTIRLGYEPVIHVGDVKQTAKIIDIQSSHGEVLRAGQKAHVVMRFKTRPVFLNKGARFAFREEKTRGMGTVVELL